MLEVRKRVRGSLAGLGTISRLASTDTARMRRYARATGPIYVVRNSTPPPFEALVAKDASSSTWTSRRQAGSVCNQIDVLHRDQHHLPFVSFRLCEGRP